ncbi:MAG TPA: IS110 family transposase [Gemmatimonadales bacterium]|nr:IS110 family transposase [Gemmatimonadales bacterium]
MRVVHERCAGLDVHKKTVVACVLTPQGREVRTFSTVTEELLALVDWLQEWGCRAVAMESTGVYWKPVYNLLEAAEMEPMVVNAQHIKAVPGRKTDVRDAEWIADLLCHGLLRASFIPDRPERELRELVRYRRSLVEERTREANRLQKVLEGANVKLSSVASDVLGRSGRDMLTAISQGQEDPVELAGLARGRLKEKSDQLQRALRGVVGPHQRFLLHEQLSHIEELEARIHRLSAEIEARLAPFEAALQRLQTIPGVGRRVAEDLLAEIGTDMSRFPTHRHLASWAKICPGNHRSAGKSKPEHIGRGNRWLRSILVEAARAAGRSKNTFLAAQYHRLAGRRGNKRAAVAVAHSILVIAYHILKEGTSYQELGATFHDQRSSKAVARRLTQRLEALGFEVTLQLKEAA